MKRIVTFLFLVMSTLLILSSCQSDNIDETTAPASSIVEQDTSSAPVSSTETPDTETPDVNEVIVITPKTAKEMIDKGGVIIVDVRREDEYAEGHIKGALLVPNETIETEAATALPDKNAVYLIYCRSGRRSNEAAHKLLSLGYTNVYDFGGILSWEYGIVTD